MEYKYISSDDHMDLCYIPPTMWQERVPAKFRDAAPKVVQTEKGPVWFREGERWGIYGTKRADGRKVVFDEIGLPEEPEPDVWRPSNAKYRLEDMDRDGIYAQVIYNFLDWSFEDGPLKAACIRAMNDWLAEFVSAAPDRLVSLATLPSTDPEVTLAEVEHVNALGLRGGDLRGPRREHPDLRDGVGPGVGRCRGVGVGDQRPHRRQGCADDEGLAEDGADGAGGPADDGSAVPGDLFRHVGAQP